jgi:DNA mismatch repair protein MutL
MNLIKELNEELINKIAAGEVVERPASVVKELVENSIDAKSTKIKIDVEEAGTKLIKISDNGLGMSEEDALICFQRHTTSKIINEDDLFAISTLGFRGEALASIAAVSKLSILTSQNNLGNEIIIENGKLISNNKIGLQKGTTIIVKDLFYNTPARKKYLKSKTTELNHIIDIVTRYALNYQNIHFILNHNNKNILFSPATEDGLNNIVSIYGKDIAKELIEVNYNYSDIEVKGFISKPKLTKLNKDFQSIYINGRFVRNKVINDAVYEAYGNLLFHDRNPIFILNIIIDVKDIDVNVHPSKLYIKLSHEDIISYAIKNGIKKALESNNLIPEIKENEIQKILDKSNNFIEQKHMIKEKSTKNYNLELSEQKELTNLEKTNIEVHEINLKDYEREEFKFKIHGQVDKTYILVEDDEGLFIVDQHAAEERINFEKFMKQLNNKKIEKQNLLEPFTIEVSSKESNIIISEKNKLFDLGFLIEEFGKNIFVIRTIPLVLNIQQSKNLLFDLINETEILKSGLDEIKYNKIASKSCRSSIKAGDELNYSLMKELIINLKKCINPYTCPHGRPTMIKFTSRDLEKMFKRV